MTPREQFEALRRAYKTVQANYLDAVHESLAQIRRAEETRDRVRAQLDARAAEHKTAGPWLTLDPWDRGEGFRREDASGAVIAEVYRKRDWGWCAAWGDDGCEVPSCQGAKRLCDEGLRSLGYTLLSGEDS